MKVNTATSVTAPTLTSIPVPVNNSPSSLPITLNSLNAKLPTSAQYTMNTFEKFTSSALSRFGKTNKKKASIDKTQITGPTNFHHVGHVGIGENNFNVKLLVFLKIESFQKNFNNRRQKQLFKVNFTDEDENSKKIRELISSLDVPNVKMNKKTEKFVKDFFKEKIGAENFEELKKQTNASTTNTTTSTNVKSTEVIKL